MASHLTATTTTQDQRPHLGAINKLCLLLMIVVPLRSIHAQQVGHDLTVKDLLLWAVISIIVFGFIIAPTNVRCCQMPASITSQAVFSRSLTSSFSPQRKICAASSSLALACIFDFSIRGFTAAS
jgi:hypothetical protein